MLCNDAARQQMNHIAHAVVSLVRFAWKPVWCEPILDGRSAGVATRFIAFVVLQDRVHGCVVNHPRFGQWYVSNNQLALFRSDIPRSSQVVQDEVIANANQIPASGELAEMLE